MTAALALIAGYLLGSLSGARIVGRVRAAGLDLSRTKVVLDGTGASVITRGVSPAALQARAGGAGGLRAGAIDILKAFLPTLAARLGWPEGPEMFLVAAGGLIGHVYPVYHRFGGGFGVSPLLGALLVIDWRAPLVAIAAFAILGVAFGNAYLGLETWPVGLFPWFIWQGDVWGGWSGRAGQPDLLVAQPIGGDGGGPLLAQGRTAMAGPGKGFRQVPRL
jgi:glycerol-3-phosphate acyltransferase PlsY